MTPLQVAMVTEAAAFTKQADRVWHEVHALLEMLEPDVDASEAKQHTAAIARKVWGPEALAAFEGARMATGPAEPAARITSQCLYFRAPEAK